MPRCVLRDGSTLDWVEWPDEPRHVLVFANAHTRIYEARFQAGEACATLFHRHAEDTVYACIASEGATPGCAVLNTEVELDPGTGAPLALCPPTAVSFAAGLCFCHLNRARNRIHRIQTAAANSGTLFFVGAEVLERPALVAPAPLPPHPCYAAERLEHPRTRAYRVTVPPRGATGPVEWRFCGVFIVLAGAPTVDAFGSAPSAQPGAAWWFEGPLVVDVRNGDAGGDAVLLLVEWC